MSAWSQWFALARRADVVRRSAWTALVVGSVLALINHGDLLTGTPVDPVRVLRLLLTYCVPYAVSTWAAVGALQSAGVRPDQRT